MTDLQALMFDRYGPLLTIAQLAEILKRSPDGLRQALTDESETTEALNGARVVIGRRSYFRTHEVADVFCTPFTARASQEESSSDDP